ncbi:hypothetical protein F7725_024485, partial [Dissostichus mawsoni]
MSLLPRQLHGLLLALPAGTGVCLVPHPAGPHRAAELRAELHVECVPRRAVTRGDGAEPRRAAGSGSRAGLIYSKRVAVRDRELEEGLSRYGRPFLGADCGSLCQLRGAASRHCGAGGETLPLRAAVPGWRLRVQPQAPRGWLGHVPGITSPRLALLAGKQLECKCVWRLCLWALQFAATGSGGGRQVPTFAKQIENLRCSGPVFAEFNRITSRNLEADFFEALDQHTPRFIQLFKSKKGSDTTRDEALSSVTVGVLTVLSEDSPQEGPSSIQLEPISIDIVLEGGIVMEKIKNFPQAVCLLFGLIYALHFKCRANTLMFVQ